MGVVMFFPLRHLVEAFPKCATPKVVLLGVPGPLPGTGDARRAGDAASARAAMRTH